MDLTSESHYKEYGLFTYIEARKLPKVESRPKRNEKHWNHSAGVAVQSCVWFENLQTSLYPLFSLFQIVLTVLWRGKILKAYIFKLKKNLKPA